MSAILLLLLLGRAGGSSLPANVLTFNGVPLTFNGEYLIFTPT